MSDEAVVAEERRLRRFNVAADTLNGCSFSLIGGGSFEIDDAACLVLDVILLLMTGRDDEVDDRSLEFFCLETVCFAVKL